MQVKAKNRVYGKKSRQQDNLDEAFATLSLQTKDPKNTQSSEERPAHASASISELGVADRNLLRIPLRNVSSNPSPQPKPEPKDTESIVGRGSKRSEAQTRPLRSGKPSLDCKSGIATLTSLAHVKDEIHKFEEACHLWAENYIITKIAYGSYAAIFRLQLRSDKSKYIIAKLMPIKPKNGKGSRAADQTSIEDAATEVMALDTMSEVPGYVGFSEAWVLRGALPDLFLQQYKTWARTHPDDGFTDYSKDQLWCFIEMSDAGTDLEQILQENALNKDFRDEPNPGKPLRVTQCWDIFWGIAEALGRGEEFSQFEHRDLHPGNVCIIKNDAASCLTIEPSLRIKYTNLEVTLIDYTLSRATIANGEILANPIKDKSIFEQQITNPRTQQQRNDDRQYETYRKMRQLVMNHSANKNESQAWQNFVPQTNTLWLHHILSILIDSTDSHSEANAGGEVDRARIKEQSRAPKQSHHALTVEASCTANEGASIFQSLEMLRESLDPDQCNGCMWNSAKALLESDTYWMHD